MQRFRGAVHFDPRQGAEFDALIRHWRVGQALQPPQCFDTRESENRRSCDIAAQLPTPLAVVDGHLAVVWGNPAARKETGAAWTVLLDGRTCHREEFAVRKHLLGLVQTSLRQHAEAEALVPAADGCWFAIAAPLRLSTTHHFAAGLRCRLERLFNLTRTEAELTVRLAQGESLEAIASARDVSLVTVRTPTANSVQEDRNASAGGVGVLRGGWRGRCVLVGLMCILHIEDAGMREGF